MPRTIRLTRPRERLAGTAGVCIEVIYAAACSHSLVVVRLHLSITPTASWWTMVNTVRRRCRMVRYQFTPDSVLSPEPIMMGLGPTFRLTGQNRL